MFKQINGETIVSDKIAPASTEFAMGDVVTLTNGKLAVADETTAKDAIAGVMLQDITSADHDYATDKVVPVLEFHDQAEFEADVEGTANATMVGKTYGLSSDGKKVDVSAVQADGLFKIVRFLSDDKVRVKINY